MRSFAYFLLYFVSIFSSDHAKEGRKVPRRCRPYVNRVKEDSFELESKYLAKISKLEENNVEKDREIRRLRSENKRLNKQISIYDYDDNQSEAVESFICPETQSTIDLESLPDRLNCDTNGKETESQCIKKLQTIIQQFISVDQELRNHQHETPQTC